MADDDDLDLDPDDPEAAFIHVVPQFGRKHDALSTCWCSPTPLEEEPSVWVHNVEQ